MKVFVTLLTGIQGQREGVYEVNRDFLKTSATAGGFFKSCTDVDGIVVDTIENNPVDIGARFDALPPLQPPPRAGF